MQQGRERERERELQMHQVQRPKRRTSTRVSWVVDSGAKIVWGSMEKQTEGVVRRLASRGEVASTPLLAVALPSPSAECIALGQVLRQAWLVKRRGPSWPGF